MRRTTEERLQRILAMVPWIAAHDGPAVAEVCSRFDCTPAELASDIELLYLCGLHPYTPDLLIEAQIVDRRVFIQYADYFSRPLRLTPQEGLSLVAAASTLLAGPGTDADGPLARGLAKLANVIGGAVDAVEISLGAAEQATLEGLRQAITDKRQVSIDYYAFGRDDRNVRVIEPAGVFTTGGQWYVSAWCTRAHAERLFRLDRILSWTVLDEPQSGPTIASTPGLFAQKPETGRVVLRLQPAAQWVVEQYPVEGQSRNDDGTLDVELAIAEWNWLDRLVLRLGPLAEVLESPQEWPGRAEAAQRVLRRYTQNPLPRTPAE